MDFKVILVPMDMDAPIEDVSNIFDTARETPIYVALVNHDNPDEFEMGFYAARPLPPQWVTNERASMIAEAVADRTGTTAPKMGGDILLRCDEVLADRILENDKKHQQDNRVVRAFRAWMTEYSEASEIEAHDIFYAVAAYAGHVLGEADKAAEVEMQQALAALMGVRPEQVGIIRL